MTDGSRFTAPIESPGFLLWHVTLAWQRDIAAALRPLGLTHVRFVLLACAWWLETHDGPPTQLQLAGQAGTDIKMTSQVLKKLEAAGLVIRDVDPYDTRAKRVHVTETGRRLAPRAIAVVEQVDAAFFGDADPEAVALLTRLAARQEQ